MSISSFHKVCLDLYHNRHEEGKHTDRFGPSSLSPAVIHTHRAQFCTLPGTKHGFLSLLFLASLVAERKDLILDQVFPPVRLDLFDGP